MAGEKNLAKLICSLHPIHNEGAYVFCTVPNVSGIDMAEVVGMVKEREGTTLVLPKEVADAMGLSYGFIAAWITLSVHSSLEAIGLTAAFSNELAHHGVSCNVVAGYYHDHIFVDQAMASKAMEILVTMAQTHASMEKG